jgi:hypothetical protein
LRVPNREGCESAGARRQDRVELLHTQRAT